MKIISISDLEKLGNKLRRQKKKIVTTNGCFDVLHVGHIRNLQGAKNLGDILIVGINSDASVRTNKGNKRPIIPARERTEMLAALEAVDYVFTFSTKTPEPWLKKIKPDIHVKGSDRSLDQIPEKALIESFGGKLVLLPHTGKHSTTDIIKRIQSL